MCCHWEFGCNLVNAFCGFLNQDIESRLQGVDDKVMGQHPLHQWTSASYKARNGPCLHVGQQLVGCMGIEYYPRRVLLFSGRSHTYLGSIDLLQHEDEIAFVNGGRM